MMPVRIFPNERNRSWFTLLGNVTGHRWLDKRNFVTKYLAKKFPSVKMFQEGLYLMVEIEIEEGSYAEAGERLKVQVLYGTVNIRKHSSFEILPSELPQYQIGQFVGVSFGTSSLRDQELTGTIPVRYELHHVGSKNELTKFPDPVLPAQGLLFFQV